MKDYREIAMRAKSENRLILDRKERSAHFDYPVTMITAMLVFIVLMIIIGYGNNAIDYNGVAIVSLPLFLIGLILWWFRKRMLRFRSVGTKMMPDRQRVYLREVIEEDLEWKIVEDNEYLIIAQTPDVFDSPGGERVTIVFDTGRVLLNSITQLDYWGRKSLTAGGWNRRNIKILKEYIELVDGGR